MNFFGNLTSRKMLAARMIAEGKWEADILKDCQVGKAAFRDWKEEPDFKAYQQHVLAEHDAFFVAKMQVERNKVKITADSLMENMSAIAGRLEAMSRMPLNTDKLSPTEATRLAQAHSDVLKAQLEILKMTQFRSMGQPEDEKPDVYQPEWMQ